MKTSEGYCVCDFCESGNGEFYDATGNHVLCQDANKAVNKKDEQITRLQQIILDLLPIVGHLILSEEEESAITRATAEVGYKSSAQLARDNEVTRWQ